MKINTCSLLSVCLISCVYSSRLSNKITMRYRKTNFAYFLSTHINNLSVIFMRAQTSVIFKSFQLYKRIGNLRHKYVILF
jgi:hypothetical protein